MGVARTSASLISVGCPISGSSGSILAARPVIDAALARACCYAEINGQHRKRRRKGQTVIKIDNVGGTDEILL